MGGFLPLLALILAIMGGIGAAGGLAGGIASAVNAAKNAPALTAAQQRQRDIIELLKNKLVRELSPMSWARYLILVAI